jgi:hypothetical protein
VTSIYVKGRFVKAISLKEIVSERKMVEGRIV